MKKAMVLAMVLGIFFIFAASSFGQTPAPEIKFRETQRNGEYKVHFKVLNVPDGWSVRALVDGKQTQIIRYSQKTIVFSESAVADDSFKGILRWTSPATRLVKIEVFKGRKILTSWEKEYKNVPRPEIVGIYNMMPDTVLTSGTSKIIRKDNYVFANNAQLVTFLKNYTLGLYFSEGVTISNVRAYIEGAPELKTPEAQPFKGEVTIETAKLEISGLNEVTIVTTADIQSSGVVETLQTILEIVVWNDSITNVTLDTSVYGPTLYN